VSAAVVKLGADTLLPLAPFSAALFPSSMSSLSASSGSLSPCSNLSLTPSAYLQLVLHAAKYQSRACIGLLVCESGAAAAASAGSSARQASVRVTGVLPLFHTAPLAPAVELALTQAEAVIKQQHGADAFIAGLYFAPELFDTQPTAEGGLPQQAAIVTRIADKIAATAGGAAGSRIVMVRPAEQARDGARRHGAMRRGHVTHCMCACLPPSALSSTTCAWALWAPRDPSRRIRRLESVH